MGPGLSGFSVQLMLGHNLVPGELQNHSRELRADLNLSADLLAHTAGCLTASRSEIRKGGPGDPLQSPAQGSAFCPCLPYSRCAGKEQTALYGL